MMSKSIALRSDILRVSLPVYIEFHMVEWESVEGWNGVTRVRTVYGVEWCQYDVQFKMVSRMGCSCCQSAVLNEILMGCMCCCMWSLWFITMCWGWR